MVRVALFASGNGSNVENIYKVFDGQTRIKFPLLVSNQEEARVVKRAELYKKNIQIISKRTLSEPTVYAFIDFLKQEQIDWIILAGFLLKIPSALIQAFPNRIINLHPSLLPRFGGQGMYGKRVHQAVLQQKETETGATVHFVNEEYDAGSIVLQKSCKVLPEDTVETLMERVRILEFELLPEAIWFLMLNPARQ